MTDGGVDADIRRRISLVRLIQNVHALSQANGSRPADLVGGKHAVACTNGFVCFGEEGG